MGDLGNSVSYANNAPSDDRFDIKCNYNSSRSSFKMSRYDVDKDIYLAIP